MKYDNPLYNPRPDLSPTHREMAKQVESLTELARRTITEPLDCVTLSTFKATMLPVLSAIAYGRDFDEERWCSLVSHTNVEVSVVDDETHKEIYRISSIYHNSDIAIDNVDEPGLSVAALESAKQRFVSIPMAQQSIIDALDINTNPTSVSEMRESGILAIERLNKIFADFDMPLLPNPREYLNMPKSEDAAQSDVNIVKHDAADDEFDQL